MWPWTWLEQLNLIILLDEWILLVISCIWSFFDYIIYFHFFYCSTHHLLNNNHIIYEDVARQNQEIVTFFCNHFRAMISQNHSGVYPCVSRDRNRETETRGAAPIILTAWSKKCDCSILQGKMGQLLLSSCSGGLASALWPFYWDWGRSPTRL